MTDSSGCSYAGWYCRSIEHIRSFLASYGSRRDSETSWLLDIITPTNPTDTFIWPQKTKRFVLEAEWNRPSRAVRLQICPVFVRTEQGKDRTGQGRTGQDRTGQDRTGQRPDRAGQGRAGQERLLSLALVPVILCWIASEVQHCLFVQLVSVLFFGFVFNL